MLKLGWRGCRARAEPAALGLPRLADSRAMMSGRASCSIIIGLDDHISTLIRFVQHIESCCKVLTHVVGQAGFIEGSSRCYNKPQGLLVEPVDSPRQVLGILEDTKVLHGG